MVFVSVVLIAEDASIDCGTGIFDIEHVGVKQVADDECLARHAQVPLLLKPTIVGGDDEITDPGLVLPLGNSQRHPIHF